jgi:hypothetical protein
MEHLPSILLAFALALKAAEDFVGILVGFGVG